MTAASPAAGRCCSTMPGMTVGKEVINGRSDRGRGGTRGVPVSRNVHPRNQPQVVVAALGGLGRLGMVVHGITEGRQLHRQIDDGYPVLGQGRYGQGGRRREGWRRILD